MTHNNTEINTVLLKQETGECVCAVDLDTVMLGYAAYDFGDSTRAGADAALKKMIADIG